MARFNERDRMEERYMTLAEATAFALEHNGAGIMENPSRFLAQIADVMNPDGDEMRVLMLLRLCNDTLLAPYRKALSGIAELDEAEARASDYLANECRIEPNTAALVAAGLAEGVGSFLSVSPKTRPQIVDQPISEVPPVGWSNVPRSGFDMTVGVTPGARVEPATTQDVYAAPPAAAQPQPVRGADIRADLEISESEAHGGVAKTVSYTLPSTGEMTSCEVVVPTGAVSGELVVVPGAGDYGAAGGARGDLRVQLHVVATQKQGERKNGGKSSKLTRRAVLALAGGAGLAGVAALLASLSRGADSDSEEAPTEPANNGETDDEAPKDAAEEPVEEEPAEDVPDDTQDEGSAEIIAVEAGGMTTIAIRSNGEVNSAGYNRPLLWTDIVAASAGLSHCLGLHPDGTVSSSGFNEYGKCDVKNWTDIVAVSAGGYHSIGLRSDGTAVAVGRNNFGQCDATVWEDLIAVSAGDGHTVGLHSDGTVVAVGHNADGQCDILKWTDIAAISAGGDHTVGLRSDGTAVAVGRNYDGQCDISGWTDLVAVSCGYDYTVGLRSDGTAVAVGNNGFGQCDVAEWSDLVDVAAGFSHTVGLRSDGKVVAVGDARYDACDVEDW